MSVKPGMAFSYVNRGDGQVRLHLHLPDVAAEEASGVALRLHNGRRAVATTTSVEPRPDDGVIVVASLPQGRVGRGTWQIQSKVDGGRFAAVGARVLVADPNPISLLFGAIPPTRIPQPAHRPTPKQRAAHRAGVVLDRALSPLPDATAARTRRTLRRVDRKLLQG